MLTLNLKQPIFSAFEIFQKLNMNPERFKSHLIQTYGDAYKAFGLNKLMGHIVALMLFYNKPISLDDICKDLKRSKGPVSQIMRRLADKGLIRKVWLPGTRKDYYEKMPDLFEQAFRNHFNLIKKNKRIAEELLENIPSSPDTQHLPPRLNQMHSFYSLMIKHYMLFLEEWDKELEKLTNNRKA